MIRSPTTIDAYVGARVKARRLALGLPLTTVSDRVGISFQQLRKYETGANRLSASRLHQVAKALNTSVAAFFPEPHPHTRADERDPPGDHYGWSLDGLLVTAEGRTVAERFPSIGSGSVRRAVADLITTLAAV